MTNSVTQANLNELRGLSQSLSDLLGVTGAGFNASSAAAVNTTNATFTIPGHGFVNGNTVTYYSNSGTALGGLTNGATYTITGVSGDSFRLTGINSTTLGTGNQLFVKATTDTVTSVAAASSIANLYQRIQDARRLAYNNIDANAETIFESVLSALSPVSTAYNNYAASGTSSALTTLTAAMTTLSNASNKANVGKFQGLLDTFNRSWAIQDRVFFEYSKTGEADLNNQLGQLGDAVDTLARAIQIVNKIDLALSVHPRNSSGTSLIAADSTLEADFYSSGAASLLIPSTTTSVEASSSSAINVGSNTITSTNHGFSNGDRVVITGSGTMPGGLNSGSTYYIRNVSGNTFQLSTTPTGSIFNITALGTGYLSLTKQLNAMKYANAAYTELNQIAGGFATGSAVRNAINDVIGLLVTRGVSGTDWANAVDPDASGAVGPWSTNAGSFKNFWQDNTFRRKVNDLQTNLSSQNDVEKQNLRKAMFVYQEFIKSAGTVMDRVYDAIKGIASRIGR